MLGFIARLVGGALDPLIDRVSTAAARLLRKVALFLVAAGSMVVVLIAMTIAFDLWIASKFGPIIGALAVAGVYLAVAVLAVVLALIDHAPSEAPQAEPAEARQSASEADPARNEQIDQFTAPLMAMLAQFGLRREQLAVLAGSSIAKQLGPLPLVGLAIVAGFLIGRMFKGWKSLLSLDALSTIFASGLFGFGGDTGEDDDADAA